MSVAESDVQILGGGVIGLACALQLLRVGRSVTVLEQDTPGAGSSHGNCGTITPSHAMPLADFPESQDRSPSATVVPA